MKSFYSRSISSKIIPLGLMFLMALSSSAQNWNEVIKAVASDRDSLDYFGSSVAIDGDYAIIGAPWETEDAAGGNTLNRAGSAYIFERNSAGIWSEVQKIVPSDRNSNDDFGTSVSIFGNYAIVGAESKDGTSGGSTKISQGSAYIFERNASGVWNEVQKIEASDKDAFDFFGFSVSISGNFAIVGAWSEEHKVNGFNPLRNAGSAYIFERDTSGLWSEVQKITATDREANDRFGYSVAISGNYAIIGAYDEDDGDTTLGVSLSSSGAAYIFERDSSGIWNGAQKIIASDRDSLDQFGWTVAIDGDNAVVGAIYEALPGGGLFSQSGAAYIFERKSTGIWTETQKIVASDRANGDVFGWSVSISGDKVIVGAVSESEDTSGTNTIYRAGSAYIFEQSGIGVWNEKQKIVASDRDTSNNFGNVSISGNYAVVGATGSASDTTGGNILKRSGSVYFFINNTAVGIIENNFGNEFKLYPNPTDGNFSVDLGENYNSITTTITDIGGRIIQTNNSSDTQLLNLTIEESSGIYLLMIESENKKAVIRIVKQ